MDDPTFRSSSSLNVIPRLEDVRVDEGSLHVPVLLYEPKCEFSAELYGMRERTTRSKPNHETLQKSPVRDQTLLGAVFDTVPSLDAWNSCCPFYTLVSIAGLS